MGRTLAASTPPARSCANVKLALHANTAAVTAKVSSTHGCPIYGNSRFRRFCMSVYGLTANFVVESTDF